MFHHFWQNVRLLLLLFLISDPSNRDEVLHVFIKCIEVNGKYGELNWMIENPKVKWFSSKLYLCPEILDLQLARCWPRITLKQRFLIQEYALRVILVLEGPSEPGEADSKENWSFENYRILGKNKVPKN